MNTKLTLTSDTIRKEKIPQESFGYSLDYVNKFLDNIADDYDLIEEIQQGNNATVQKLNIKIEELENIINMVSGEKNILKEELSSLKKGGATDYTDVLKRITNNEEKTHEIENMMIQKLNDIFKILLVNSDNKKIK